VWFQKPEETMKISDRSGGLRIGLKEKLYAKLQGSLKGKISCLLPKTTIRKNYENTTYDRENR